MTMYLTTSLIQRNWPDVMTHGLQAVPLNLVLQYSFKNICRPAFTVDRHRDAKVQIPLSNNTILCI